MNVIENTLLFVQYYQILNIFSIQMIIFFKMDMLRNLRKPLFKIIFNSARRNKCSFANSKDVRAYLVNMPC